MKRCQMSKFQTITDALLPTTFYSITVLKHNLQVIFCYFILFIDYLYLIDVDTSYFADPDFQCF